MNKLWEVNFELTRLKGIGAHETQAEQISVHVVGKDNLCRNGFNNDSRRNDFSCVLWMRPFVF